MSEEKKVILVVEDEDSLNDLMCAELEDAGYTAVSARNGKDGLRLAREISPDMILQDVVLPDMNGIQILKEITKDESLKRIPFVMVTSKTDLDTKISSFVSGARRYLVKPFLMEDLLKEVENTFRQIDIGKRQGN